MRKSIQNCIEILAILEDQQFLKKKLLKHNTHYTAVYISLMGPLICLKRTHFDKLRTERQKMTFQHIYGYRK